MREKIEEALRVLVGLPLWSMGRVLDLEWLQFGGQHEITDRRGRTRTVGDYALHVQTRWRIVGPHGIVNARGDLYWPAGAPDEVPEGWSPFESGSRTRLDERTERFKQVLAGSPPVVESVTGDELEGFRLALSGGYALEVSKYGPMIH